LREFDYSFELRSCGSRIDCLCRNWHCIWQSIRFSSRYQSGCGIQQDNIPARRTFAIQNALNNVRILHRISTGDLR